MNMNGTQMRAINKEVSVTAGRGGAQRGAGWEWVGGWAGGMW